MNMRLEGIEKAERNVRTEDGGITVATLCMVQSNRRNCCKCLNILTFLNTCLAFFDGRHCVLLPSDLCFCHVALLPGAVLRGGLWWAWCVETGFWVHFSRVYLECSSVPWHSTRRLAVPCSREMGWVESCCLEVMLFPQMIKHSLSLRRLQVSSKYLKVSSNYIYYIEVDKTHLQWNSYFGS